MAAASLAASMASKGFRLAPFVEASPGPLTPLAENASSLLRGAKQNVTVFESGSGGLVQAALLAVPGASAYTTCWGGAYSTRQSASVLGSSLVTALSGPRPAKATDYMESKMVWTTTVARQKRLEVGTTWCVCESGACGPTFNVPDLDHGFSAIFVSGPVEKGILVESTHNRREDNMWSFAKAALDLLAECITEAQGAAAPSQEPLVLGEFDRFGGVEVTLTDAAAGGATAQFDRELRESLAKWKEVDKKGVWLKVPLSCAHFVAPAAASGFRFHHAMPEYVSLTKWLPDPDLPQDKVPLPKYAFTQIGVGGIVVNSAGEVLMVQERVSPLPQFQDQWKLPGGLADPGEEFAATAAREVEEETGVKTSLIGLVSLRHSHGYRFGQGDIYCLAKLKAETEDIVMCEHELKGARWMSLDTIKALVKEGPPPPEGWGPEGAVSANNWKMISNAFGPLIEGTPLPASRGLGVSMLYTAPKL